MNATKTSLTILAALAIVCAGSLKAELGETPAQFETGKPTEATNYDKSGVVCMTWRGKSVAHTGVFHLNKCVAEEFSFADRHLMTVEDVKKFLAPYSKLTISHKRRDEKGFYTLLTDKNGEQTTVVAYFYDGNKLTVMTLDFWNRFFEENTKDTPQPVVTQPSSTPNDCLIVATEVYGRLKSSAYWAKIIGFYWVIDGERTGHAMTLYQPTPTSNVFLYDKLIGGSKDLGTQSHDLSELVNSIKATMKAGVTIEESEWID